MKLITSILILSLTIATAIPAAAAIKTERVAEGLSQPIFVTSPPDDSRLFIVEQLSGRIKILENGTVKASPFLDVGSLIISGGERGLLGLAFHPDYPDSGYIYLNYTRTGDGATTIARYTVSANPDSIDEASGQILLTVPQPFSNHNAGMLAFGPDDGYLYIGLGDGGSGGDPNNLAQDSTELLGKMLRIDVDAGTPYDIPPTNPFIDKPEVPSEIWALGLRNPWRYSFDRQTGDLFIADVGQNAIEEINFQAFDSPGGENYGWRCYEGSDHYNTGGCNPPDNYIFPVYEYTHSLGRCSITGGYVYRGCALPELQGTYFFADYCTGEIWSFEFDGVNVINFINRTSELDPGGGLQINNIASFGEDADGELYIVDIDGEIYKIVPDGVASACSLCGDINSNGLINILDVTFLIAYIYQEGPAPDPPEIADVNNSGTLNILDITYLIAYLYQGGPAPDCPSVR